MKSLHNIMRGSFYLMGMLSFYSNYQNVIYFQILSLKKKKIRLLKFTPNFTNILHIERVFFNPLFVCFTNMNSDVINNVYEKKNNVRLFHTRLLI